MIATDSDSLDCDFAQTYQIYDWRALSARRAAVFAYGLPTDSRIKLKMSGSKLATDTQLQAAMLDALHMLLWIQSKDGAIGANRPQSVLSLLLGEDHSKRQDRFAVDPDDFEALFEEITKGGLSDAERH